MLEAGAGAVATEKLPVQVCASGSGASETTQQFLPAFETVTGGFSAWSIPMRSHTVFVCRFAHSLGCEDTRAQADTGSGATPANPRATKKLRTLRIFI